MRQPFILGAFLYVALVAGRITNNGNGLMETNKESNDQTKQQDIKGQNLATANPIIRSKRVTNDPEDITFWANRGRRSHPDQPPIAQPSTLDEQQTYMDYLDRLAELSTLYEKRNLDGPFWGNRGKRLNEDEDVYGIVNEINDGWNRSRRDDVSEPFWGNRGRRNDETNIFWGNRGRRAVDEGLNREDLAVGELIYKRSDVGPFWGNRGKKESNKGKKDVDESPFWGNRGKKNINLNKYWEMWGKKDIADPFWGNRGKKEDFNPFWGNRGKRNNEEPFWGNRGKKNNEQIVDEIIENANVDQKVESPLYRNFHKNVLVNKFIKNIMRKIEDRNEKFNKNSFSKSTPQDYEYNLYDPQDKVLIYADKNLS